MAPQGDGTAEAATGRCKIGSDGKVDRPTRLPLAAALPCNEPQPPLRLMRASPMEIRWCDLPCAGPHQDERNCCPADMLVYEKLRKYPIA
jgi:hypothetical protein